VCGDQSVGRFVHAKLFQFPPRARGSIGGGCGRRLQERVFLVCAGIDLTDPRWARSTRRSPRVCGDQSSERVEVNFHVLFPSRVRGSIGKSVRRKSVVHVSLACAGSIRLDAAFQATCEFPRSRGDQSGAAFLAGKSWKFPRVCGNQSSNGVIQREADSFLACVDRSRESSSSPWSLSPCVRGSIGAPCPHMTSKTATPCTR
jgi:hypothetical protein